MLTLARAKGERIVVGKPGPNQVVFTIIDIRGDKAIIGVNAEPEVPIHRAEIYRKAFGEDSFTAQGFGGK